MWGLSLTTFFGPISFRDQFAPNAVQTAHAITPTRLIIKNEGILYIIYDINIYIRNGGRREHCRGGGGGGSAARARFDFCIDGKVVQPRLLELHDMYIPHAQEHRRVSNPLLSRLRTEQRRPSSGVYATLHVRDLVFF